MQETQCPDHNEKEEHDPMKNHGACPVARGGVRGNRPVPVFILHPASPVSPILVIAAPMTPTSWAAASSLSSITIIRVMMSKPRCNAKCECASIPIKGPA